MIRLEKNKKYSDRFRKWHVYEKQGGMEELCIGYVTYDKEERVWRSSGRKPRKNSYGQIEWLIHHNFFESKEGAVKQLQTYRRCTRHNKETD